jgi:hypothetical protein
VDQQLEQVHPEVVEIGDQIDFFGIARKVLPWVVLAFVLFRVGSLFSEFSTAQLSADRRAAAEAAATTLTASQATKGASTATANPASGATPAARGPYVVILSDGVNFHAAASNSAKVLGALKRGAELSQLGRVGNWLKLKDAKGTVGYVYDNPKLVAHKQ